VVLPQQPFEILRMLIEREGEMVTRDEIQKKLWPNDTIVEFDHSINAAVNKLRQALGDSAVAPRYIETVTRRGYRLMVPAEPIPAPNDKALNDSDGDADTGPTESLPAPKLPQGANLIGKKVSHYRVAKVIGVGGMGLVYEAEDLKLGRAVALKFLPEDLAEDPAALQRFEREARASSSLDHPNICTIYEVEEHEGQPFIVMQLLRGETLRDRLATLQLAQQRFAVSQLIDIAVQICDGLAAAHNNGIIHRDIKPANIFLTTNGPVKILDFGLAKLIEAEERQEEAMAAAAPATAQFSSPDLTITGLTMGTAGYMSPEQVRGEKLDARTDLFSFGLVLYEMATGKRAFTGETAAVVKDAIQHNHPTPLRERNPALPSKLESIVNRAIEKDRERRCQSAAEMLADLLAVTDGNEKLAAGTSRKSRRWTWIAAVPLVCVSLAAAGFWYWRSHRLPKLTEQDTILVADFENKTGDDVFDKSLQAALQVSLAQSPFLNILSAESVADTLQQMTRPADTKLTPELAAEVCIRSGSKAYTAGTITSLGKEYALTLDAVDCHTGHILASEEGHATAKEGVLGALGNAASSLRNQLGESLATIDKFNVPLYQATTQSLEALKSYSLAREADRESGAAASLPYLQRAIEMDSNFAAAYFDIGWDYMVLHEPEKAKDYFKKVFELQEHATRRERLGGMSTYYQFVTGETGKAIEADRELIATYPRNFDAYDGLGVLLGEEGKYEEQYEVTRKALALAPDRGYIYSDLAFATIATQRFDLAAKLIRDAQQRNLDDNLLHKCLYALAFILGDTAGMAQEQLWFERRPQYASQGLGIASDTAAYSGKLQMGRGLTRMAANSALQAQMNENGALLVANAAVLDAAYGNAEEAKQKASEALNTAPKSQRTESEAALAFALSSNSPRAESLTKDLDSRFPLDTQMQSIWLPVIRAQVSLNQHDPAKALANLQAAIPPIEFGFMGFNRISCLYTAYIRGQAYLSATQGSPAAAEFQKILDHPGLVVNCWTGALARLGLARAYVLEAQTDPAARDKARAAYENFLTLWKDADPDIPIYKQAKAEYAKLNKLPTTSHQRH
jgi:serine/threonine protein kinase/tetratricopeptide (TPR) repeat protein